jgi:hypothetical protein
LVSSWNSRAADFFNISGIVEMSHNKIGKKIEINQGVR